MTGGYVGEVRNSVQVRWQLVKPGDQHLPYEFLDLLLRKLRCLRGVLSTL